MRPAGQGRQGRHRWARRRHAWIGSLLPSAQPSPQLHPAHRKCCRPARHPTPPPRRAPALPEPRQRSLPCCRWGPRQAGRACPAPCRVRQPAGPGPPAPALAEQRLWGPPPGLQVRRGGQGHQASRHGWPAAHHCGWPCRSCKQKPLLASPAPSMEVVSTAVPSHQPLPRRGELETQAPSSSHSLALLSASRAPLAGSSGRRSGLSALLS